MVKVTIQSEDRSLMKSLPPKGLRIKKKEIKIEDF